jgi:hypothetical protein
MLEREEWMERMWREMPPYYGGRQDGKAERNDCKGGEKRYSVNECFSWRERWSVMDDAGAWMDVRA